MDEILEEIRVIDRVISEVWKEYGGNNSLYINLLLKRDLLIVELGK